LIQIYNYYFIYTTLYDIILFYLLIYLNYRAFRAFGKGKKRKICRIILSYDQPFHTWIFNRIL